MRFFISLSYNGRSFNGWQVQPGHPSVQSELERAFSLFFGLPLSVTGAGRTDSGVHAVNYVAHIDIEERLVRPEDLPRTIYKINAILPSDIVIHDICQVQDDAHARFDATSRSYNYFVHTSKDPFLGQYSYFYPYELDIDKMNEAAQYLLGEQDFTSMAKLHTDVKTNICTVTRALWHPAAPLTFSPLAENSSIRLLNQNGELSTCVHQKSTDSDDRNNTGSRHNNFIPATPKTLCFTITANRFLRNMVRAVVGSLLEVGRGRKEPIWIKELLEEKNRSSAGNSVPAHPLFLTHIEYPYPTFNYSPQASSESPYKNLE